MYFLDTTFATPAENLALEEAWLTSAEAGLCGEGLRLWDAQSPFVVLGRGSKVEEEVHLELTQRNEIPVFRRISGGATIMAAKGCMFYGVILSLEARPELRMLDQAHQFVLDRLVECLQPLTDLELDGTSDLTLGGKKISGNSLRITRDWLLYHGTLLLDLDLRLISTYLRHPPREPDYRNGRKHESFLTNMHLDRDTVAAALRTGWQAHETIQTHSMRSLHAETRRLVSEKYSQTSWNFAR